jgi:hypothetical protein
MRISHFIIINATALAALFAVGCSKSSSPIPTVTFQGYTVGSRGNQTWNQGTFEFRNPGKSPMVCQVQIQPDKSDGMMVIFIPPNGRQFKFTIPVEQTNAATLSVTVMRMTPVHQIIVPMQ